LLTPVIIFPSSEIASWKKGSVEDSRRRATGINDMQVHERVLQQIRSSLELPFESENGDLNALNAEELGSLLKGSAAAAYARRA
jgi:hypothetical protein